MTGRSIAVVGAGIIGCLIARELTARDPDATVTVLDRDLIGSGVTRRSAGVSLVKGGTPRTRQMSAFSHAYYAALRATLPGLPIYPVDARLVLPGQGDPADSGYLPEHIGVATAPAESLAAELQLPAKSRVWQLGGCHYADVPALTQVIAALSRPRVRFAEAVKVTALTVGTAEVTLTCGSGEQLRADQVVLAPGPWLAEPAWADLLAPLGLRVKKIVAMHLERPPGPDDELVIFDEEDAFLLPVIHRGHWLFSYTRLEWDVDPNAPAQGLSPADVEAARECLRPYSPALADACVSGRVCCDAYSRDHAPVVSALDDTDGRVIFAGAANGSGYRLGPAIANQAVNLLYDTDIDTDASTASQGATDDHQHV
ncbi:MAG TPA: FAD-binding oxidoreductase [Streptosporangiaceae bacterium]|nr:FAD-binding oxidoreductase [Streptosporangiaceae bacterium]